MAQDPIQQNQQQPSVSTNPHRSEIERLEQEASRLSGELDKISSAVQTTPETLPESGSAPIATPSIPAETPQEKRTASPEGANLSDLKSQILTESVKRENAPQDPIDRFDVHGAKPSTVDVTKITTPPPAPAAPIPQQPISTSTPPPEPTKPQGVSEVPVPQAQQMPPNETQVLRNTTPAPAQETIQETIIERSNPLESLARKQQTLQQPAAAATPPAPQQVQQVFEPTKRSESQGREFFDNVTWNAKNQQAQSAIPPQSHIATEQVGEIEPPQKTSSEFENFSGSADAGVSFEQSPNDLEDSSIPPTPPPAPTAAPAAPAAPASMDSSPQHSTTPLSAIPQDIIRQAPTPPSTPPIPQVPEVPQQQTSPEVPSTLRPIRTFKADIESTVQQTKTSVVDVIAAEQVKRSQKEKENEARAESSLPRDVGSYLKIAISGIFVGITLAALVAVYFLFNQGPQNIPVDAIPEYVFSEENTPVDITGLVRRDTMNKLLTVKNNSNLRLGAIHNMYITRTEELQDGGTRIRLITTSEFLEQINADAPDILTRALDDTMMFGAHTFDQNQPFLIFKTTFFENTFAGMLQWEDALNQDLAPLFGPVRATVPVIVQDETSTSTRTEFVTQSFVDDVISNKEVRVLLGENDEIILLYGFLDRNTLVITTNEQTFKEIVTRVTSRRF